jgi:hypothetical protein
MKILTMSARGVALLVLSCLSILVGGKDSPPTKSTPAPTAGPIPQVPADEGKLVAIRDKQDQAAMRKHAWDLLDGLAAGPAPVWRTWCAVANGNGKRNANVICPVSSRALLTKKSLFMADVSKIQEDAKRSETLQLLLSARHPRQAFGDFKSASFSKIPHDTEVTKALIEGSEVLFDPKTAGYIEQCFGIGTPVKRVMVDVGRFYKFQLGPLKPDCPVKPTFEDLPVGSMAVKTIWAVAVPAPQDSGKPLLSQNIAIWDSTTKDSGDKSPQKAFPTEFTDWPHQANINLDDTDCSFQSNVDGVKIGSTEQFTIPLGCFYSIPVKLSDIKEIQRFTKTLITARSASPDEQLYLILLGFHVATREIPGWTWQTYWWSRTASQDKFGEGIRAGRAKQNTPDSQWSHYVMDTTFGPANGSGSPLPPVNNPYLEGMNQNGLTTNCFSCHRLASFHTQNVISAQNRTPFEIFQQGQFLGSGVCNGSNSPCWTSEQEFLATGTQTGFLWSIADSNAAQPSVTRDMDFLLDINRILLETENRKNRANKFSKSRQTKN